MLSPEFISLIQQHDVIGLQETKTDDTDTCIDIPGYKLFFHNRCCISRYRSGGIALLVKDTLLPYIKIDHAKSSKLILFFTISKTLYKFENHDEDLVCGIVYIPPQGSKYAAEDPYLELQQEIMKLCLDSKNVLLFGDFNSRCKNLQDYVRIDEHMCDIYGMQDIFEENSNLLHYFEQCDVPLHRISADNSVNSYGYNMLEFCKNNDLFILNGRIGNERTQPHLTCKNSSTVDYFISSAHVLPNVQDFYVHDFSPLYSDVHCPITLFLNIEIPNETNHSEDEVSTSRPKLWSPDKSECFVNNIDILKIAEIEMHLDSIQSKSTVSKEEINEIVSEIGTVFESTARTTFGSVNQKRKKCNTNKSQFKPWFNSECFQARNMYHKSRQLYNKYKTEYYKNILKIVSKKYKKTLSTNNRRFIAEKNNQLRSLKNQNPREYWKIINSHKQSSGPQASLENFYQFFKSMNEDSEEANQDIGNDHDDTTLDETIECDIENEVNQPITEAEILQNVKLLKNNKASGIDCIVNEHIKSTAHLLLPTYCKLFNIILDTGIIPESWTVGIIKPIYKNKGDPNSAENYRPITMLSCFGKLFTSILNNRLNKYAEKHDTINWCQAGFRKNFSTSDNLFVLKSLIDIAKLQHNKLYCCFVDFKQAFDTVWRVGLWHKLRLNGFKGKCYNLIKNLYEDIKSKVSTREGNTDLFDCTIGVRQGENLSPFLFSIFLNDLEDYLFQKNVNGITCDFDLQETNIYLKLIILLYADDTVIFSDSENGLQHALNMFSEYCNKWRLTVNTSKTKIIIFNSRGKPKPTLKFSLNGHGIDIINEYKYLGIYFSQSGTFAPAKKHISEQANKAVFALLKNIKRLSLPYDIQIDLFEKTIKPILLYGCEIWGIGNNDIIERVQLNYFKQIFGLKKSTPSYMLYGEIGIMPLEVDIKSRVISFWSKLIKGDQAFKLSAMMYNIILSVADKHKSKILWIEYVKTLLCSLGFSGIWYSQDFINRTWLIKATGMKIKDLFLQNWRGNLNMTSGSNFYKIFKTDCKQSEYLKLLPTASCKIFMRFRTRNHKLPVETGRWRSVAITERKCHLCESDVGDEYHYLLTCNHLSTQRRKYIKPYYYNRPNTLKLEQLMNTQNIREMRNLCLFINHITKLFD